MQIMKIEIVFKDSKFRIIFTMLKNTVLIKTNIGGFNKDIKNIYIPLISYYTIIYLYQGQMQGGGVWELKPPSKIKRK